MRFEDLSRGPLQTFEPTAEGPDRDRSRSLPRGWTVVAVGNRCDSAHVAGTVLVVADRAVLADPAPASRAMRVVTVALVFGAAWLRLTGRDESAPTTRRRPAVLGLVGCTRNVGTATDPTASAGIPPALTVATVDLKWLSERVGGDAVEVPRSARPRWLQTDADLLVYVPGLDAQVDAAAAGLPQDRVIDVTGDVNLVASARDAELRDPYVWFDPVNVGTMAQTVAAGLTSASPTMFEASRFPRIARPIGQNEGARRRPAPAGDVQSVPDTDVGR